jgi:UDP-N-acetylglucosamine transferase subunit ALG13
MSSFVSVGTGTQSFARLLERVAEIAHILPQPVIVQHGRTPFSCAKTQNFDFVDEQTFQELLANCELFITHGGSGSVSTALRLGKKPVVVPRRKSFVEHVDDHQLAFVNELARMDLIYPVLDIVDLPLVTANAVENPTLVQKLEVNENGRAEIKNAVDEFAAESDKVLLVCPSGGHLSQIRALASSYIGHPHFYVINMPIVEAPDMQGRTQIITLSQRDWKFLINLFEAYSIIRREKPRVILTTGGGFSVAFTLVGKLFGVKTVYVETVAKVTVPTETGRIMYILADRFFYQWPYLKSFFPRGKYVGLISLT